MLAAILFSVGAVVSVLAEDYWLALCQGSSSGVLVLSAARAERRGRAWAAVVWVLLGLSFLALVAVMIR